MSALDAKGRPGAHLGPRRYTNACGGGNVAQIDEAELERLAKLQVLLQTLMAWMQQGMPQGEGRRIRG